MGNALISQAVAHHNVPLPLDGPQAILTAGLQVILDRVGTALLALERWVATGERRPRLPGGIPLAIGMGIEAQIPGTAFPIQLAEPLTHELAIAETRRWLLLNGATDLIGVISEFFEQIRVVVVTLTIADNGVVSGSRFAEAAARDSAPARKFAMDGLPGKLNALLQLGLAPSPEVDRLRPMMLSINKARNCLEHRLGLVQEADLNEDKSKGLVVRWVAPGFFVRQHDGSDVEARTGAPIDAPHGLEFRPAAEREAIFPVGTTVDFSSQQFQELVWTIHRVGDEITRRLVEFARSRGASV